MHFLGTFECGNNNQFTSASGSVQTSVVKEGVYAGRVGDNHNFLKNINTDYGLGDIAKTWAGAWFRWSDAPPTWSYLMLGDGATTTQWSIRFYNGKLRLEVNGTAYLGSTVIAKDTWYFILVEFYCHDSQGYAKIYINGGLELDTGRTDTKSGSDTGVRQIKWQGVNNSASIYGYVDNCLFSDVDPRFVMKVAKPGFDVNSMDIKNLSFHSDFPFLKFHSEHSGSVTFAPKDTEKSLTFSHSLGYVPAFVAYFIYDNQIYIIPSIPFGIGFNQYAYAYATNSSIVVGVRKTVPHGRIYSGQVSDGYTNLGTNYYLYAGNYGGSGLDCGYRFTGVSVPKNTSIHEAMVDFRIDGRTTGSDVKIRTWGINEDNVGSFGSDLGKSKTSSYVDQNVAAGSGSYFGISVTSAVQQIVNRSGWSSGNAMGFYTFNNGSASDIWMVDELYNSNDTRLSIYQNGNETWSFKVIIFKDQIA